MKNNHFNQLVILLIFCSMNLFGQHSDILPGEPWKDVQGNLINAHGGGVLYHGGIYYWFGEIMTGKTWSVEHISTWECYRVKAAGISCYSSNNLVDWRNEGVVLAANLTDSCHDLYTGRVIERPKVIYNEKTKKFVMWLHVDSEDYSYARAGVAISDHPAGPYTYLKSFRPNDHMSRDMTLFKDTDGKAYHIYSSENNATMHISMLTVDYLRPSGIESRIFIEKAREAPVIFKHNGIYYLISSGCTGWTPNKAMIASADTILGPWTILGNPCTGTDSEITFHSQGTFVLAVDGKEDAYIFMADRWNKTDLEDSRHIWLPISMVNGIPRIIWKKRWDMKYFNQQKGGNQ